MPLTKKYLRLNVQNANRRVINRSYESAKSHWQYSKVRERHAAHRCSEQALQNKRKKRSFLYIQLYMEEIGKAIERNSCIRRSCVHLWWFKFYLDSCDFTLRHFNPSYRCNEKIMKNDGGKMEFSKKNVLGLIIDFYWLINFQFLIFFHRDLNEHITCLTAFNFLKLFLLLLSISLIIIWVYLYFILKIEEHNSKNNAKLIFDAYF